MKRILLAALLLALPAAALDYPKGEINVIVPASPGGVEDRAARAFIETLEKNGLPQGTSFTVANVLGGSGLVGMDRFASSPKNGYTLGILSCDFLVNSLAGRTPLVFADFVPLAFVRSDPYALAVPHDAPYRTFEAFVEYARKNPRKIIIGDIGPGSVPATAARAMARSLGLELRVISYPMMRDCLRAIEAGELQAAFVPPGIGYSRIVSESIRFLALTTSDPYPLMPDLPSISKLYPRECGDMNLRDWICIAALQGTPLEVTEYLREWFVPVTWSDEYTERLRSMESQEIMRVQPDGMRMFFASQAEQYLRSQ